MQGSIAVSSLLERETQLAAIAEAAGAAAAGEGRLLSVIGAGGLGKSTLLAAAADAAADNGLVTLQARGAELERDFPFGLVLQLFGRSAREYDEQGLFIGAASLARPLLLGERPPADFTEGDPAPIIHGLFWVVSELAQRSPVALLLDDVHWADELSLRFVLHVFERARDVPGLLAVAARPAEPGAAQDLIARIVGHEDAIELRAVPLSPAAVAEVVGREGFADHAAFAEACHEVTGGNPLLLRELLRALREEGASADAAGTERVRAIGPEPVSRALLVTMSRLPGAAGALSRALAVLGDGAPLRSAAAVAGLELDDAAEAAAALETAGVFRREAGLGFVHPILRAAVYNDVPPTERAGMHRLSARVVEPDAPVERVAAHLWVAAPIGDPWTVETLERAAARAVEQGAPDVAVAHLRRALEEPPAEEARARILTALGRAEAAAGDPGAAATIEQAVEAAPAGRERALLLLELGRLHTVANALRLGAAAFDRGAAELNGTDEELRLELEAAWVMATMFDPEVGVAALQRVEPLLAPGVEPRTPGQRKVLAHLAGAECLRIGDLERGLELGRRAWGDGALLADTSAEDPVLGSVTAAFTFAEHFEESLAVIDAMIEDARRRGSALGFATASYLRGSLMLRWGRPRDGIADLEAAIDGRRFGWEQYLPSAIAMLAECVLEAGDEARAVALLDGAHPEPGQEHEMAWGNYADHRGNVALIRGEACEALECYERAGAIFGAVMGQPNPIFTPWRRGSAIALARLGRHDEALERVEEDIVLARRWGAPGVIGQGLVTRGVVLGREGLDDLREGVATIEPTGQPLAYARSALQLGMTLRAGGQRTEAQDALRHALDAAERCGSGRIAGLAREELLAAGARPRRAHLSGVASLTPSELRVARMAAEGRTNREIAEALFVTRKAITWHLGNAYRKLGIGSREDLGTALAGGE